MPRPIKTLLFSTLFPSSVRPVHGIFVETRLRELLKTGEVETKVVAPVAYFPFSNERFGEFGKFAATPCFEHRNGLDVFHPRYFLPPKIGMNIAPHMMARGAFPTIQKLIHDGFDFDLIDAHYYYPDGVAASFIARWLGKPFTVTGRGSDLNLISNFSYPRKLILQASKTASASIGVSRALIERMTTLGMSTEKLVFLRNGIDLERFRPEGRKDARRKLGLKDRPTLISVGNLVELKGHHIAIEALQKLPEETCLIIVGSGPEKASLEKLVGELRLSSRVQIVGQIPNEELRWFLSAADALVLCSSREGWPNVLLESMACGTPVIATNTGGIPELISSKIAGQLMLNRSATDLAEAYLKLISEYPDRNEVRKYAEHFSWLETSSNQLELFRAIANA